MNVFVIENNTKDGLANQKYRKQALSPVAPMHWFVQQYTNGLLKKLASLMFINVGDLFVSKRTPRI